MTLAADETIAPAPAADPNRPIIHLLSANTGRDDMPLWQRLLITLVTMLLTSLLAGLLWRSLFNTDIPSYLSGVVGGVTAVPVWELLKRVQMR